MLLSLHFGVFRQHGEDNDKVEWKQGGRGTH